MDDDATELRDRIEQLERIAAEQQETIEELKNQSLLGSWGRRGVLGGIAAALGLSAASGSAAAGVGDVGTPSERVDVFADTLDADETQIGNVPVTSRQLSNISDDSVKTLDLDPTIGGQTVRMHSIQFTGGGSGPAKYLIEFNGCELIASFNTTSQGKSILSGTTGPDGTINVAVNQATIYVENRTGQETNITTLESGRFI